MDNKKLFVGNLPWSMSSHSLKEIFIKFGDIEDAVIISDRTTGRSRGFGFITFVNEADAQKAKEAMDGKELEGRNIVVNIAKKREEKPGFGNRPFRNN